MNLQEDKSPLRMSPSDLKREYEASKKRDEKEKKKEKEQAKTSEYHKELKKLRKYKQKRLKWQMDQSKERARRSAEREAERNRPEPITAKDTDPTATTKILKNMARVASPLVKAGASALYNRLKNKKEKKPELKRLPPGKDKKQLALPGDTKERKRLMPAKPKPQMSGAEKLKAIAAGTYKGRGQVASPPSLPPSSSSPESPSDAKKSARRIFLKGKSKSGTLSQSQSSNIGVGRVSQYFFGAKRQAAMKKGRTQPPTQNEEYSCWREEFLYELGDLRKKARENEDKPIDVMRGKNKIKLNPTVTEIYNHNQLDESPNTASIFAKATPLLKARVTPLSDIVLSKQPGKKTAENIRDEMRRAFLGDLSGFRTNFDLSGHASDDNDVSSNKSIKSEAYDDYDETFRQHSRERFTAGSSDEREKRRKAASLRVIAAMKELNKDIKPPKKKKKKKKEEGQ